MENLELQKQIISLGKLLVKELGSEENVDTLSRWIAHYLAEKILEAEALLIVQEKKDVERECFEIILKLWEQRWVLPSGKRPFEEFEPLLEVLEKINPEALHVFFSFDFEKIVPQEENTNMVL